MSRSYHQTIKSVFGGKSRAEINKMIEENDPDFLALLEKMRIKRKVKNLRQLQSVLRTESLGVDAEE